MSESQTTKSLGLESLAGTPDLDCGTTANRRGSWICAFKVLTLLKPKPLNSNP